MSNSQWLLSGNQIMIIHWPSGVWRDPGYYFQGNKDRLHPKTNTQTIANLKWLWRIQLFMPINSPSLWTNPYDCEFYSKFQNIAISFQCMTAPLLVLSDVLMKNIIRQSRIWNLESRIWSLESRIWNLESGTENLESGFSNVESGIWNLESGTSNLESGIWNLECGIWNLESRIWNLESGM